MTTRYVPFARSMSTYSGARLRTDVIAGVTVAALALPASMAYAQLAGVPVSAGLYALLLPVLAYAVLGSAPRVVVGPEGTVALLVATAIAPLAASGSAEYTALAAMLAIMVGLVFLVARLARLGWIADYFSQAVLVGYITGVAIVLVLGQLGKLVGISSDEEGAIRETLDIFRHVGDANGATVIVGALALALLLVAGRISKRIPGALLLVVLGIAASWALDLAARGVSVTGPVPSGLPSLEVPALSRADLSTLVVAALAVFVVAFSDSILTARSFAARHHEVVDANQELLAFGVAQISAGVTQGIPVGTSGSRTAVNDDMRATSQVSGVAAAATIAAILMFLTAPIQHLPSAVLGAVIVYAGAKLIDPAQWRALARSSRVEVVIAAITVLCVVTIGVLQAIIVAVVLSVADILRRAARPADAVLGWSAPGGQVRQRGRRPRCGHHPGRGRLPHPGPVVLRKRPLLQAPALGGRGRRPQARATRGPRRLVHQCHRRECGGGAAGGDRRPARAEHRGPRRQGSPGASARPGLCRSGRGHRRRPLPRHRDGRRRRLPPLGRHLSLIASHPAGRLCCAGGVRAPTCSAAMPTNNPPEAPAKRHMRPTALLTSTRPATAGAQTTSDA